MKFLRDYANTHGIPRTIRLDQATCLVGKQITNYCNENNINIIDAPVGDHRAIGLVVDSNNKTPFIVYES